MSKSTSSNDAASATVTDLTEWRKTDLKARRKILRGFDWPGYHKLEGKSLPGDMDIISLNADRMVAFYDYMGRQQAKDLLKVLSDDIHGLHRKSLMTCLKLKKAERKLRKH